MGWRADEAYEKAQMEDFRQWKASLTWREYLSWQGRRWGPFAAGALSAAVVIIVLKVLLR
jgi:hypothetical protein